MFGMKFYQIWDTFQPSARPFGGTEAQKLRKKSTQVPPFWWVSLTTLLHLVNFSNFHHKTGYLEYVEMYHWWNFCGQGANLGRYIGLRRQKIAFGSTLLSPVLCPWRHSRSLGCENEVLNLSLCCLTSEEFGDNHFASSPLYYGWDVTFYFSSIYERKFHINITSFNAGQISTVNPISKILLFMFYIFYWHFIIPKNIFHDFSFGKLHAMNLTSGGS